MKELTIALAILLIANFAVAEEFVSSESSLDAVLLYYEPVPAQPGDQLDVWIQIENNGGDYSKSGKLTILDSGPFRPNSEREREHFFTSIPGQEAFLVKTKVRVTKDADEGDNVLTVRLQEDGRGGYTERDLEIAVKGTTSTLSVVSAVTEPKEIFPGDRAQLIVDIKNIGQTKVRNVDVSIDFSALILVPTDSSNTRTVSSMSGGETRRFIFDLISNSNTETQIHKLPMTLEYDDEQGNSKSQNKTIGILIGTRPELLVYFERVGLTEEQLEGEIVVKFVNKGLDEIRLLEAEVIEGNGVEVISESPIVYVGNIDEDDYESTELNIKVNGETDIPIRVAYRDALNREYEEQIVLPLRLQSANGNGSGTGIKIVLAVLVVAGLIYWWSRRGKKRK